MATVIRELGRLESYHVTRHYLGCDSCLIASARYLRPDGQPLDTKTLYSAMRSVIQQHAALGVALSYESTDRISFTRLTQVDLSEVINVRSEGSVSIRQVMEEQFLNRFDTKGPLWRLVILSDDTVMFCWHHGIGDGKSGLAFHKSLLDALNNPDDGSYQKTVLVHQNNLLVPSLEAKTDVSLSLSLVASELCKLVLPKSWHPASISWTGEAISDVPTIETHVRILDFSSSEASELLRVSRTYNTTITAAISETSISVLSEILEERNIKGYETISYAIPVSLRPFTDTPAEVICDHVSVYNFRPRIHTNFSWDNAQELSVSLRGSVAGTREVIGSLKLLFGDYEWYFRSKFGKKRDNGIELSNLGQLDLGVRDETKSRADSWTIERMRFAQCNSTFGPAIKLNAVSAPNGELTICVAWGEGAVDCELAESFTIRFANGLRKLINPRMC